MNNLSSYSDPFLKNCMKIYHQDGRELEWQLNTYPDGQLQVKIKKSDVSENDIFTVYGSLFNSASVDIFFQFIESFETKNIKINYFYGARSDKDESGDYLVSNTALQFCERIRDEYFLSHEIEFLAPHCFELCQDVGKINFDLPDCVNLEDYDLVIYPDESAHKRFTNVNKNFIICEKHRDQETGNIISHKIPYIPDYVKKVLVLDDLADAGGTFINVAKALPENVKADLFIFHGVFTNCAPIRLFEYYENIYVSNSLPHVQKMADIFNAWKNHRMNYKLACEQLGVENFLQYKDFISGNLIVFDVWKK